MTTFSSRRVVSGMLAVACVGGLLSAQGQNSQPRTQAVQVAAVLNAEAQPGDVVVYCPDQLGPAVDRLLKVPGVTQLTYPRMIGPARVDWVDYVSTIQHTDVGTFAQEIFRTAQPQQHVVAGMAQRVPGLRHELRQPGQLAARCCDPEGRRS